MYLTPHKTHGGMMQGKVWVTTCAAGAPCNDTTLMRSTDLCCWCPVQRHDPDAQYGGVGIDKDDGLQIKLA